MINIEEEGEGGGEIPVSIWILLSEWTLSYPFFKYFRPKNLEDLNYKDQFCFYSLYKSSNHSHLSKYILLI